MTPQQVCTLALVTAILIMTSVTVWRLSEAEASGSGGPAAILTSSVVLYIVYLFSTAPDRRNRRK